MSLLLKNNTGLQEGEIIYHIFQRSFYDTNGDAHGDLAGVLQKLDYLQQLGVSAILLTPLYKSDYYHNYFADDFESIDSAYGTFEDYFLLIRALHARGMKLLMDMEVQYVAEDHEWFKESLGNPDSHFSEYIVYKNKEQTQAESILFNINGQLGYNGIYKNITTVNLLSKKVQDYVYKLFSFWMDPHLDGSMRDGVDGFRLDHMMDVLDEKPQLSNLFNLFWKPLLRKLKKLNPDIFLVAEQTNWDSFGMDYLDRAAVDSIFAFPLREAVLSLNKEKIEYAANVSFINKKKPRNPIVFIENHDTHRYATLVHGDDRKLRLGAAFNLLFPGIPAIYYGQEIGMQGGGGFGKYGNSDGNDIPRREAFKWFSKVDVKGMALWYKDTGPWWDDSTLSDNNGISLEEQQDEPTSLWSYYSGLIQLRKTSRALAVGDYKTINNNNPSIFSFTRFTEDEVILVAVNLSESEQHTQLSLPQDQLNELPQMVYPLWGATLLQWSNSSATCSLPALDVGIWRLPFPQENRIAKIRRLEL